MNSCASWPCAALPDAELSGRTTLKVGGRTQWLLEPATPEELRAAIEAAREQGFVPRLLGGGANLLIEDGLHAGVVIATERLRRIFRPPAQGDTERAWLEGADSSEHVSAHEDPRLFAWAGASLPGLVHTAGRLGLSGFEGLVGVPGNLGGGLAMNAGGRWGELWDQVESVQWITPDGRFEEVRRSDHQPSYRNGRLEGRVLASAVLRLLAKSPAEVQALTRKYLAEKRGAQPLAERSAGCIFKNPPKELSGGRSAGLLIQECGLKGRSQGDAAISEKHGNFLVNRGRAQSRDVLALIAEVQAEVAERTGVVLEQEVQVWRRP